MGPLNEDDFIYGTSTIRRYLLKFQRVVISDQELNERLNEVMKEEIEEEEVEGCSAQKVIMEPVV